MRPALSILRREKAVLTCILARQSIPQQQQKRRMSTQYETLAISSPAEHVLHVQMNRPKKRNAMSQQFFKDIHDCFAGVNSRDDVRAIVLSGAGKMFTAGLDLMDFASLLMATGGDGDVSRKALAFRETLAGLQKAFSVLESANAPVIAAVHNACVGGGVDLISACDIRLCSSDAWFQVKEVDLGIVADLGTLQRLPRVIGNQSLVRELCYTARKMNADEAKAHGFVSKVCEDYDSLIEEAVKLGSTIAEKSPVAVTGTKVQLNYARDHSVQEGLDYVQSWNMSAIQTEDLMKAVQASMSGEKPVFSKL